jgi:microcystin-dependent protein
LFLSLYLVCQNSNKLKLTFMEGTIAEIRMFAGNFAPNTWLFCAGQTMSIAQNTAMFSLLGTTFGGNGQTTFGIPDFRGRVAVGTGTGPGLPNIQLGQMAGSPNITLLATNMPAHTHAITGTVSIQAAGDGALGTDAVGRYLGPGSFYSAAAELQTMAPAVTALTAAPAGGSQPINIMPPYLGMNYIICQFGIFPSRN